MKRAKRTSYSKGLFAEALCRWALRFKGYHILATRYKSHMGEIDIIALKGRTVAMVEVKARRTEREALEAVLPRQRQRLYRASLDFLTRHAHFNSHDLRFDLMLVPSNRWPIHIRDAWRPDL